MKEIKALNSVLAMVLVMVIGLTGSRLETGTKTMPLSSEVAVIRTMPLKSGIGVLQTLQGFQARNGSCCKAGEIKNIGD